MRLRDFGGLRHHDMGVDVDGRGRRTPRAAVGVVMPRGGAAIAVLAVEERQLAVVDDHASQPLLVCCFTQRTGTAVASACARPSASASSKHFSALAVTGSEAWIDWPNATAVARSFFAAMTANAVSPGGLAPSNLAITAPRPFIAVGVPAVSDRMSISRSGGRLSGLQIVSASPSA